jgi:hypothetical protein
VNRTALLAVAVVVAFWVAVGGLVWYALTR